MKRSAACKGVICLRRGAVICALMILNSPHLFITRILVVKTDLHVDFFLFLR